MKIIILIVFISQGRFVKKEEEHIMRELLDA